MKSSFLQSAQWAEFQKSLGREVFNIEQHGISVSVIKHELRGRNYLYIPFGPEMDFNALPGGFDNPVRQFVGELKSLAKREHSIFIKAEPSVDAVAQLLVKHGFRRTTKEIQPHRSVIIDLQQSEDGLLAAMHHKTRYNIKVAEGHGLKVEESDNVEAFVKLIKHTADKKNFGIHPEWYYKKLLEYFPASPAGGSVGQNRLEVKLILVKKEQPVAGAVVLLDRERNTGYYLHGASDYRYRSLMAPYLLHWHIIRMLKQEGFDSYDFWGIDAQRWPGVTRFKLGWGGKQVEYPGSFDLPISKFWYLIYKIYRAIIK